MSILSYFSDLECIQFSKNCILTSRILKSFHLNYNFKPAIYNGELIKSVDKHIFKNTIKVYVSTFTNFLLV